HAGKPATLTSRRKDAYRQGRLPGEARSADEGVPQAEVETAGNQCPRHPPPVADLRRYRANDQVLQRGARLSTGRALRKSRPQELDPFLPRPRAWQPARVL